MGYASPNAVTVSRLDDMVTRLDDILDASYLPMTVDLFQGGIATGDADNPERINDGDVTLANYVNFGAVPKYVEVDFRIPRYIGRYRIFWWSGGSVGNKARIDYWDGSAWVEWIPEFIVLETSDWGEWITGDLVLTTKIRFITTAYAAVTRIVEMEVKV